MWWCRRRRGRQLLRRDAGAGRRAGHAARPAGASAGDRSATACSSNGQGRRTRVPLHASERRGAAARCRPGAVLRQVDRHRRPPPRRWRRICARQTLLLSLQNGVDNADTLAEQRAVRGDSGGGVRGHRDGRARPRACTSAAATWCIGHGRSGPRTSDARLQQLAQAFAAAGVPVRVSADVVAELWSKLLVNCAYNAISGAGAAPLRRSRRAAPRCERCRPKWWPRCCAWRRRQAFTWRADESMRAVARHRRGDAGAAVVDRAGHGAAQAQRDRPSQRHHRAPRPRTGRGHAGQPGAAGAGQAGRIRLLAAAIAAIVALSAPLSTSAQALPGRFCRGAASARPGRRRAAARRAADRRGVVRHLAHRHRRRAAVRQARACRSCAWRPTGRRRSSATVYEARWMQVAQQARARQRAAAARPAPRAGRAGDGLPAGACAVEAPAARWRGGRSPPPPRWATRWCASTPTRQRAPNWPRSSTARRSSSTSASSPICWRPRRAIPIWPGALHALVRSTQAHALALVHGDVSPKNILDRHARAGAARCRMRGVGRPGLRPGLLPQPPAAEVPVEALRRRRASWPVSPRCRRVYLRRCRLGAGRSSSRRARRSCCRACCWRAWTASRRSSTSPTTASASVVRRVAREQLLSAPLSLRQVAGSWQHALAT